MAESCRLNFCSASFSQNCVWSHTAHTRGRTRVEFIGSWGPKGKLCRICGIIFSTSGAAGDFWIFYSWVIAQQWQAAILWEYFNMYVISILVSSGNFPAAWYWSFRLPRAKEPNEDLPFWVWHFTSTQTRPWGRHLASISNEDQIFKEVRWNMADADAGFSRLMSSWRVFLLTTAGLLQTEGHVFAFQFRPSKSTCSFLVCNSN